MRMRVTTRTAEVMPLDTRAVEVEINKEEPITTTKHTKISPFDLFEHLIVFAW